MKMKTLIWPVVVLFLAGCSKQIKPMQQTVRPPESPEITEILTKLTHENPDLSTFKGTGKIKFWKKNETQIVRAAWTGSQPDKLRIVIQGITGYPVASMAADGYRFYLLSYTQNSYYKSDAKDPNLEKLVSVPVTASEIIKLLSGTLPIREYYSSDLIQQGASEGYALSLKNEKGTEIEKIHLDQDKSRIQRVEMFTPKGEPAYKVELTGETEVDGYKVPSRLVFNNEEGLGFQLDMDQFWPNAPVSPDLFMITPQG
jgi:hypothetical protein